MLRRAFVLGLLCLLMAARTQAQNRTPKFDAGQVDQLLYLPPIGLVGLIGAGNRPTPDAQLSADSEGLVQEMLLNYIEPLHLGPKVKTDTATQKRLRREVLQAVEAKLRGGGGNPRRPCPRWTRCWRATSRATCWLPSARASPACRATTGSKASRPSASAC